MEFDNPAIRFHGATPYAFYFEHAHLVLFAFERDDAKFLFRIRDQREGELDLEYPGETFSERVLDAVQRLFFIQVQEAEREEAEPYVLGSYFEHNNRQYGAYYAREAPSMEIVLFRLCGEGEEASLEALDADEYQSVSTYFVDNFT